MTTTSAAGGRLDLDSNAECVIDNVNNENVFWAERMAPSGTYIVRVHNYQDCVQQPVNYTVTVQNDREVSTFRGTFAASTAGEVQVVTTFEH